MTKKRKNHLLTFEVLHENLKIVLPIVILTKKNPEPQLHQIFKPIKKFFCTFLPIEVGQKKSQNIPKNL